MLSIVNLPSPEPGAVCVPKNGAPCTPSGIWTNFSTKVFVENSPALTSSSCMSCLAGGGLITLSTKSCQVSDTKSADNFTIPPINTQFQSGSSSEDSSTKNSSAKQQHSEEDTNKQSDTSTSKTDFASESAANKLEDVAKKSNVDNSNKNEQSESPESLREKRWCSGRCPSEYKDNCQFCCTDSSKLLHSNSSSELKSMIERFNSNAYTTAYELIHSVIYKLTYDYSVTPTDTAHHLIPGNECLSKKREPIDHADNSNDTTLEYELLVKLANFFDYNVNNHINGIILPTYYNAQLQKGEEPEVYYNVMNADISHTDAILNLGDNRSLIGSQLHLGPHSFDNRLRRLKAAHPEYSVLTTYERIVLIYLNRFQDYYLNSYSTTCFMKNREQYKEDFINRINDISNRLRKNICSFPSQFPVSKIQDKAYVSFAAMLYDLKIPLDEYRTMILKPQKE